MKILLPGATIGILGSGQLGRMTAQAAIRMGYRVATLSPDAPPTPCGQVGARGVWASYDDLDAVASFAQSVDVVTFEFENVPAAATEAAARFAPVRPGGHVLHTTQNRLREKTFLEKQGVPIAAFRAVSTKGDCDGFSYPAILKTAGFGYDGKGQRKVSSADEARAAWSELGGVECVLEALVNFAFEISLIGARGIDGSFTAYPPVRNDHVNRILDITTAPAPSVSAELAREAEEIAHTIFTQLDVIGILCIEFFVTADGGLLVNELAPRPHNSGHWTIEGAHTSQFEQQVRAVCGLPLGSTEMRMGGAAMANLLGDLWPCDWPAALAIPGASLHLYGKAEARPGRKMGHLTALGSSPEEAVALVRAARAALTTPG